jgi:hypothetical protein
MERFFNTTGPCYPERHYMLPPDKRLTGAQLHRYISHELYWVLHAPRQTGKTTFLQSWMREINAEAKAVACYVSVERCQEFPKAEDSIPAVCSAIREYSELFLGMDYIPSLPATEPASALSAILKDWAALTAPKPLVVLFDEVDVLRDQALVSFLRQLRGGFAARGVGKFPVSVALVGMRDLRDYLIKSKDGVPLNPGSPFNIKEDSASLSNFTPEETAELIGQHRKDTGQKFTPEAERLVWDLSRGQPWLVNALCKKCVWKLCPSGETVSEEQVLQAKELLVEERAVHLDSLAERLRDPRVKRVIQTILTGESDPSLTEGDDFRLTLDLGLVNRGETGPEIANPIYREVIARVLSQGMQDAIAVPEFPWKKPDGGLDMEALLRGFQRFWRRHADLWETKTDYAEAFPHLILMAYLQRVVNGGGRVEREFAAGRGRVDLGVYFGGFWNIIEIKLVHPGDGRETAVREGLERISRYRESLDPEAPAYLVLFDRTPAGRALSWDERLTWDVVDVPGRTGRKVAVVGG